MPRHLVESPPAAGSRHPADSPAERAPYARSLVLAALSLSGIGVVLAPDRTVSAVETVQVPASPADAWAVIHQLFENTRGATCEA